MPGSASIFALLCLPRQGGVAATDMRMRTRDNRMTRWRTDRASLAPGVLRVGSAVQTARWIRQCRWYRFAWSMRAPWLLGAAILALGFAASPAAADEMLAPVAGVGRMSAYGGWVVFTVQANGASTLHTWHDGTVAPVGVPMSPHGFDVDVGPDALGRPTAVYSRCRRVVQGQPPRGCNLFAVTLGEGTERRLAVSRTRYSEFAPAIWGDMLVFGRRRATQRRADIVLARPGRPLKRLGAGSLPSCKNTPCRRSPSLGFPLVGDLGPEAVAYNWRDVGGDTFLGSGSELRVARLDGSRARVANAGWSDGTCGSETHAPNVTGASVLYGVISGCGGQSVRRFHLAGARRFEALLSPEAAVGPLAWDGSAVYWVRRTGGVEELMRTQGLAFRQLRSGEDRPPIEVEIDCTGPRRTRPAQC